MGNIYANFVLYRLILELTEKIWDGFWKFSSNRKINLILKSDVISCVLQGSIEWTCLMEDEGSINFDSPAGFKIAASLGCKGIKIVLWVFL